MSVHELSSAPTMRTLYPRAVAGAGVSLLRRLPVLDDLPRGLPDEELVLSEVEIDRGHLAAYDRVCTFELRDVLPPTYPHVLAFPLAMKLMTDGSFPFPAIGLVHIRNRIEQMAALGVDDRLTVRVRTEGLSEHDKGTKFEVVAEAWAGDAVAWRSTSTYLHRESGGGSGGGGRERSEPPEPSAEFDVPGDIGRRYAAVSGDRNPIHLHPLAARLFGMPRHIAHGMWAKARCLALLDPHLPQRFSVEVDFKLPLLLPARVAFASWPDGDARGFALHDARSGKPHLAGAIGPLAQVSSGPAGRRSI